MTEVLPVVWEAVKEVGKVVLPEVGKAAAGAAAGTVVKNALEDDKPQVQTFDQKAADRKAALQAAASSRKRIAQQTTTLLTSPLGATSRIAGGAIKTLLGQ